MSLSRGKSRRPEKSRFDLGFATAEGTSKFKNRFLEKLASGHFREAQGLWFSSVGAGSYLGEPDERTDLLYKEGLQEAIRGGVNVIDSAINYRCQRSERSFGKAIREMIEAGEVTREELIICTKGGFLPFDNTYPRDPSQYFSETFIETGLLTPKEIVQGCHAMSPGFLENQLERSLENFGLETLDIYYVHNPETQLAEVNRKEFMERLQATFEILEKKVSEGKIRMYGTATWSGYRTSPENSEYLSLEEVAILAREVGGANHHFRVVQLPLNLGMPEAWVVANQDYGAQKVSFLEAARKLGIVVMASASLLQGQLARPFPPDFQRLFPHFKKSSQCSLQFVRSCPGVVTALVGMKTGAHVIENLETAKAEPFSERELTQLFQKTS